MALDCSSVQCLLTGVSICSAVLCIIIVYKAIIYPRLLSPLRHLPSPEKRWWSLATHLLRWEAPITDLYLVHAKRTPNDGIIRLTGIWGPEQLLLTSGNAVAEVLVKNIHDYHRPGKIRRVMSGSTDFTHVFFTDDGYRRERRMGLQYLGIRRTRPLYSTFWNKSVKLIDLLVSRVQNDQSHTVGTESFISTTELDGLLIRFTLDNAGLSILGRDLNTLQGQEGELTSLFDMLTNSSFSERLYFVLIDIFPRWIVRRLPLKAIQKTSGALDRLQVLCKRFVDEKRMQPVDEATQPRDVVSNLIQWEQFSPEELAFYVFMYLLLGHSTVTSSVLWTIYLLAKNRETQSQLRKEISARIPSGAAATSTDDAIRRVVENTPLLDAVCSESLRLYPALHRVQRIASKDSQILGTAIPKGTMILLTPWVINRSPYLWGADAEEFNAYRWIDSKTGAFTHRGGAVQDHCMMSFGQGQMSCVGKEYGRAEMKVFIAVLLSTLDIELVEPAKAVFPDSIVPHKPVDDVKLRVRKV